MPSASTKPAAVPPASTSSEVVGKLALRFGVMGGVLCAGWMLGLQATGSNPFGPKVLLAQLLVPLLAVAAEWRLRQRLAPERPGVGRALTVGGLAVLLAALIAGSSVVGLASGAGEQKLLDLNRREAREITVAGWRTLPPAKRNAVQEKQQLDKLAHLTITDLALNTFTTTLLLGLALALPGGIFFRE